MAVATAKLLCDAPPLQQPAAAELWGKLLTADVQYVGGTAAPGGWRRVVKWSGVEGACGRRPGGCGSACVLAGSGAQSAWRGRQGGVLLSVRNLSFADGPPRKAPPDAQHFPRPAPCRSAQRRTGMRRRRRRSMSATLRPLRACTTRIGAWGWAGRLPVGGGKAASAQRTPPHAAAAPVYTAAYRVAYRVHGVLRSCASPQPAPPPVRRPTRSPPPLPPPQHTHTHSLSLFSFLLCPGRSGTRCRT